MNNLFKKFHLQSFKKAPPPVKEPKIVNPWPDEASSVNVFVVMPTEDLPRGRYTFVRQAYVRGQEAKYNVYGFKGSWRESGLKEAVIMGNLVVLPSSNLPPVVTLR